MCFVFDAPLSGVELLGHRRIQQHIYCATHASPSHHRLQSIRTNPEDVRIGVTILRILNAQTALKRLVSSALFARGSGP
jgi:hypothetical protein